MTVTFVILSLLWACGDKSDEDTSSEESQEDSATEEEETEDTSAETPEDTAE